MNMVEFRQNLESGPTGSGRPRSGHPRPQPILKPSRWTFSCCTPAMSPPTPEDEPPVEATTPMPSPPASSTTAAAVDETPPNAAARATSPSDAATRAAYHAAADFDEDVPLPGEILTREELEFYSDVREDAPASPGDMLAGLPSWLDDDDEEEEEPVVTEPAATYRDVGEEPARADDADGESPDAERGAEGGADLNDDDDDDDADVSVAELLDSESDPAFAFRPSGVASETFRGVLYGNYAPVGDDETLGESSSFEVEREVERERGGEERDHGRGGASTTPLDDLDDQSERGTAAAVAELWSDVRDARAARERRVSDMRAFLRRVRAGDDGVDRRVKFPPSPEPVATEPEPPANASDGATPESVPPPPGPARVAAVSPRTSTVRALDDRDWSPMLPSTRVGLQRLVDGDAAVVRAFEGEEGQDGQEGEEGQEGEKDTGNPRPLSSDRSAVVASASELRVALGLPARGKPQREPTEGSSETVKKLSRKPSHAARYAFGSSVETGRGALAAAAEEAARRDEKADAAADFLRRGQRWPRSRLPAPEAQSAIRAGADERREARLLERRRAWGAGGFRRREGRVDAESRRTAATEEEATAPARGLRERTADEANREKRRSPPAGKRIAIRDESDEDENARESLVVEEDDEPPRESLVVEEDDEPPPLVLYPRTISTGAQCDARTGADTAVQVRMDADEDSVEPRVVLRIDVVDDRPIDEPVDVTKTAGGEVKAAFETLGYYAAAGVESADAQIQTMGREELRAHGRLHIDVADAAGALRSGEFPDEHEDAPTNPLVTKLQLQLRAVGVLVGAQRAKHGRRLAALRERYVEVCLSLREQDRLLAFSEAAEKIRREREAAARRRRRGATERWRPPGGGVFLDARRPGSHNVHVQSRGAAWTVDPETRGDGQSRDDPWQGSRFKREMLASLARKLLMKCALGAFAAAAAERRGMEAYVRRVWSRNRAPAVRVAFEALRNVAARMRQLCDVADDAVELRLRKRCADACAMWSKSAAASKSERKSVELARAHRDRRALNAAVAQWRRLPLMTEFDTHMGSLAGSFRQRKLGVTTFHAWRLFASREAYKKLKLEAAMPGEPKETTAAKARLNAARKPSEVKARANEVGEESRLEFIGSRRRVAGAEAAAALKKTDGWLRFRATEADCRWVSLASPHMRRFRRLAVDEIKDEEEGYKGTSAAIQRTREALEHLRKVRRNGSGIQVEDEFEETELLEAARKRAAAMRVFDAPGSRNRGGAADSDAPEVPPSPALDPSDVSRVKLAAATDETAVKARELAREAAADADRLAKDSEAKVSAAKAAQKRAAQAADAVAAARLDRARRVPPSSVDSSEPSRDADSEAEFAAAAAKAEHLADAAASAAADATREAIAAEANAAAAKAVATSAAGTSQVADAVALEVHDARARADASSARAEEAFARVAKARAGAARQRELAEDASRNMSADPDTVSEIRGQADSSTAEAIALERDAALARAEADAHEKAATSAIERRDAIASAAEGLESARRAFRATRNRRDDAYKRVREADALAAESVATARAAEAVENFWAKRLERAERDVAAAAESEEAAARNARDEQLSFTRREAKRLRAEAEAAEEAKLAAMAAADAAEKTAGDTARAASDEAAAARESAFAAEALAAAAAAELEAARQKVDTLRRRADAAERSARVHVELAAEAAAYGRELNSDPAFRARKAEAFAAAVVEAENFLRHAELAKLRAISEAKEVAAAADAAERTAAGVATAEIERSLEYRTIADDAQRKHREVSASAADAESEVARLESADDPAALHRDLGQRAREERTRAESRLAAATVTAERRAEECGEFEAKSVNAREELRSVAAVAETAPAEMTRVAAAAHELLSAVGADAKRSHGLAEAERADAYLLASVARWREEAARLATERSRVEVACAGARDREAFAASVARIAIAENNAAEDAEKATAEVATHADAVRRLRHAASPSCATRATPFGWRPPRRLAWPRRTTTENSPPTRRRRRPTNGTRRRARSSRGWPAPFARAPRWSASARRRPNARLNASRKPRRTIRDARRRR